IKIEVGKVGLAHANNAARMKKLILKVPGISEFKVPIISHEELAKAQAKFNESAEGLEFYHEEEAYEMAAFIGHSAGKDSNTVSFVLGDEVANSELESATVYFYLRAVTLLKQNKARLFLQSGTDLASAFLTVPNSPTKRYAIQLNIEALHKYV
ncbi:hypothetical protein PMAYCL1PPCAC_21521, partial [Pristionchus mayeri]